MSNVLTYDPSHVTIVLSGFTLTGILAVDVGWKSKPYTFHKGIRNVHTRVMHQDLCATVKLEVMQTSITNDVLSDILTADLSNNSAILDLMIKDTGGSTMLHSAQCYISSFPKIKLSQGFENRQWEIEVFGFTSLNIGGNSKAAFDIFSSVKGALSYL